MLIEGYDNDNDNDPIVNCLSNLITNDQIDPSKLKIKSYQLTFSSTKTANNHLRNLFNHYYKAYQSETENPNTYEHVLIATSAFINELEKSKLYSKIRMIVQPSLPSYPHGIKLHFDIEDKLPYFLSASNEYDTQGAQLKLKFGNKNFLGYHDQFAFEFDKNLSTSKSNWSLNWSIKNITDTTYSVGLKKTNIQQQQGIDENISEINCSINTEKATLQYSNAYRANLIENDDTLTGEYLFRRYLHNLDFIPTKSSTLTYSRILSANMGTFDNMKSGSVHKLNLSVSIPKQTMNPFIKVWMSHQIAKPLYEHRKKIKSFKHFIENSSIQCCFNYGLSKGFNHLDINDTFQNIQYRGFNQLVAMNGSYNRKYDLFAKADLKYNIHNLDGLKQKNLNLFYYSSFLTIGEPKYLLQNLRASFGIGITMPLGAMNLECLVPLLSLKKQFDKEPIFQIRIATDD